jgi:hypothetical protein
MPLRQNSGGCQISKEALKDAPWHLKQLARDTLLSVSIQSPNTSDVTNIQRQRRLRIVM